MDTAYGESFRCGTSVAVSFDGTRIVSIRMTKVPLFWTEGEAQTGVSFWLSVSVLHAWDNLVQIYIITIRKVRCVLKRSFRLRDVRFILAWSVSSLDDHSIGI